MRNVFFILSCSVALATPPAPGFRPDDPVAAAAETALRRLRDDRARMGLDPRTDFTVRDAFADALGQVHVRLQQTYRGLRVWGGQAIVHFDASGAEAPRTDALVRGLQVETSPNLAPAEALAVAQDRIAPKGAYADAPEAELVLWREPGDDGAGPGPHLAWHVHAELENGADETRHEDLLVEAHTGAVLKTWSTLFTARRHPRHRDRPRTEPGAPAEGLGRSQYSGEVNLATLRTSAGYLLIDPTRGRFSTRNLGGRTTGSGVPYVNPTPTWGDGQNYDPGRGPDSANGQTAAVDAHYGLQVTWDFYRDVLGRNGIDGKGTGPTNLVHYAKGYDNAFWSDGCFCMTYGDGRESRSLTSLDVVAHEVSHGLCSATAGLDYEGEAGGLNEANSDIFGAMIRFYARGAGGKGGVVPDQGGAWTIGEDVNGQPYRYMIRPSRDGWSPDAWHRGLRRLDPHLASGPMNRAFYLLAQGASPDPASPAHVKRMPEGFQGIGNDKALRIWWRALSTRLTPASGYHQARAAMLAGARELYGADGPEARAVDLAFRAINVTGRKR